MEDQTISIINVLENEIAELNGPVTIETTNESVGASYVESSEGGGIVPVDSSYVESSEDEGIFIDYCKRIEEIAKANGDDLVIKVTTNSGDDTFIGAIDKETNKVVIIKSGENSYISCIDNCYDIVSIFVVDDNIISVCYSDEDLTVVNIMNKDIDLISQKILIDKLIDIEASCKWNDNYLFATNTPEEIDGFIVFRQAIVRCDNDFNPIDLIKFDDVIIADMDIPVEQSFTKIECLLPLDDKLIVASIGGNNDNIRSNIIVINNDYQVDKSKYFSIADAPITKIGVIYINNDDITISGIYTNQNGEIFNFFKKIDIDLNII